MRIVLADDHPLILVGLRDVLEESDGFEVVGEARSSSEVLPLVRRTEPDLVLLDLRLPPAGGLHCLEWIRAHHPAVKVVILSVSTAPEEIGGALARGASGYISKSLDPGDLPGALRGIEEAEVVHGLRGRSNEGVDAPATFGLTERELTIVCAAARGLSNRSIAKELWVSEQTVKFHLTNVYRKLGVSNRTEAARWAYERGLAGGVWLATASGGGRR
jgi:DNA-binding NarL/FixJ family response regulator